MADAAKALGIGPGIEFRGQKYRLTPWTMEMTALFEAWLEQRAWDAVERTRGTVPEDVYQRRLDTVARLIAAGKLSFGSEAAAEAARSLAGLKYSTFLQLQPANPGITERLVEELFAEKQAELTAKLDAMNAPDPSKATEPTQAPPSPDPA